jgi:hypothetical protein
LRSNELTLRGLVIQLFRAVSSVDGRLLRSLRCLLRQPGALTSAYLKGQRQPYLGPFALFFSINAVFFVTQSLTGVNIFSSPLDSHLYQQDWSALAQLLVSRRLEATHTTLDQLTPLFDQAVVLNAKSLIVLMVLSFSVLLPVLFHRSGRPVVAHVAFSLHLYAFLLLLFCVLSIVSALDVLFGGVGLKSTRLDNILTGFNLAACASYLYFAAGTVYGSRGLARILKVAALTVAVAIIVLAYRFALFLITLYTS